MEIKSINLNEIRVNNLNVYEMQCIEELADSIKTYGQLENATVYSDEQGDGKKYTLIGGHRRYLAISYLAERGEIEPLIHCSIIQKPEQTIEENLLIIADNQQRTKDKDTKLKEIKLANDYYKHLVEIGERPAGRKRAWIAKKVGMSERSVQDILTEIRNQSENSQSRQRNTRTFSRSDVERYLKLSSKNLAKADSIAMSLNLSDSIHDKILELTESIDNLLIEVQE